ncbi:MAG: YfhO family protein [Candidatus Shapirobacteria bacterium]|nr:YfhO family protein [Candidatus Shapirobacteria bacterium]
MKKFFSNSWPFLIIIGLVFIFFWKFFFKGLLPIPGDIITGLYFPWIDYFPGTPTKNPLISDIVSQIFIWKSFLFENFGSLIFPLWDKTILSGSPLLASYQPGFFYPLNIFYWFLSSKMAFSYLVISQSFLALIFTFLYLREIKLSKLASFFGAMVFSFSAFAAVWSQWGTVMHAGLYLPLVLFLIEKYLSKPKPLFLGFISLALAFSVFAGHFQITLYLAFFSFVYALFRVFTMENNKKRLRTISFLFLSFALAILIAAVQLIPTLELSLNSFRGQENYIQYDNFGLIAGRKFLTFIAPDFFGNPTTLNYWGGWNYQESAFYLGILPLFFLGFIICRKRTKLENFYLVWFLAFLLLVFDTPVGRLIYDLKIPFLSQSFASRGIYLLTFSAAILSALGFDYFLKEKLKKKNLIFLTILVFLLVLAFLLLRNNPELLNKVFINSNFQNSAVAVRNLILPMLLIFVSWLLFLVSYFLKGKLRVSLFIIMLLILFFDLFRFADKYLPFVRSEMIFPKTPVIEFLQKQEKPFRIEKESSEIFPANMWSYYGLESASGYNPLYPSRYAEFISVLNTNEVRFNDVGRYALVRNFNSQLFDLLNEKYLLVVKRSSDGRPNEQGDISYLYKDSKFKLIYSDKSVAVLENPLSFPRAFLVEDKIVEKHKEKIAKLLLSKDINLRKTVILEEEIKELIKEPKNKNTERTLTDSVEFTKYSKSEETLRINAGSDKILFISETFYPGWKAFLDGKEIKIYQADYAFKAFFVPKGEHQLKLIYDPWSFKLGGWLSLTGIIICAFLLLTRKKL